MKLQRQLLQQETIAKLMKGFVNDRRSILMNEMKENKEFIEQDLDARPKSLTSLDKVNDPTKLQKSLIR